MEGAWVGVFTQSRGERGVLQGFFGRDGLIKEAEVDAGEESLANLCPGFFLFGGFELAKEIFGGGEFAFAGWPAEDELVGVDDGGLFLNQALRGELGLFVNEGAVHEEERLGGEVGNGAFTDDEVGVGGIENLEEIEHGVAEPGDVDAAPVGVEFVVEIVLAGIAEGVATALGIELAADEEGGIADAFGFESLAMCATKKAIFGVVV